jgi:hypothetical protein
MLLGDAPNNRQTQPLQDETGLNRATKGRNISKIVQIPSRKSAIYGATLKDDGLFQRYLCSCSKFNQVHRYAAHK